MCLLQYSFSNTWQICEAFLPLSSATYITLNESKLFGLHYTSCISPPVLRTSLEFFTLMPVKYHSPRCIKQHSCNQSNISLVTSPLMLILVSLSQHLFCTTLIQMCILPPSDHGCRLLPVVLLLQ